MDGDKFDKLARSLIKSNRVPTIRSNVLMELIVSHFVEREYAAALCSQLIAIATVRRIQAQEIEDVYDSVVKSMTVNDLSDENEIWYRDRRPVFLDLLRLDSVRLVAKTLHLSTDYTDILIRSNLVTDIRPVFSSTRDTIFGAVVTQSLRLHYLSSDGSRSEKELSLALDADDIEKLISELEKAKLKSKTTAQFLDSKLNGNVLVLGDDKYGFS